MYAADREKRVCVFLGRFILELERTIIGNYQKEEGSFDSYKAKW
jgi:hypothetical protein